MPDPKPTPGPGLRLFSCSHESNCLAFAAHERWPSFNCADCRIDINHSFNIDQVIQKPDGDNIQPLPKITP